jgi:GTP-binding protein Era
MPPDRGAGAAEGGEPTRAGDIALVGRPNVGKSTLLNAFTGERLSIVTPRAQTTRERVLGIYTDERAQLIFVDTPGLLEPKYLLQRAMVAEAEAAVREADLVLLLLDGTRPDEHPPRDTLELLSGRASELFVAINKVDVAPAAAVEQLAAWGEAALGRPVWRMSAETGARTAGVAVLLSAGRHRGAAGSLLRDRTDPRDGFRAV